MYKPQRATRMVELLPGASALSSGLLWLHRSRAIVAADAHLAYEDAIGGALPLWSTSETFTMLLDAVRTMQAREVILLGDVIHGSRMSEGAIRAVQRGLEELRAEAELSIVAGNHEGRSRGVQVLGETHESLVRDGWLMLHGDRPPSARELGDVRGTILGHLHPSLPLGGGRTAPAFLAGDWVIVVPALTPYSTGLSVLSDDCLHALQPFNVRSRSELHVVAATGELCYPFGSLSALRGMLSSTK